MTFTFVLLGLVILLFIAIPLFKMMFGADPAILWDTLLTPEVMESIWLTLYTALIATAVGCILGVPLAYLLARYEFSGKKLLESIIDVPIVIPHSAAGIALLFVFGWNYFGGKFFGTFGIEFIDSVPGIVIAMLFVSVPFLIDSAKEGFRQVDNRLEKVSRSLGTGIVYQDDSFFPHLTVRENVIYGLHARKKSRQEIEEILARTVSLTSIEELLHRKPGNLSGREKRRVLLARSLSVTPKVLLLDEPLSALDPEMRDRMVLELKTMHRNLELTTLHV
jgi:energy-coupling factor transporter ATP-binding protein EcfA2